MGDTHRSYIPAAGYDWLLPLYDPLQRWLVREAPKRALIADANILPGQRVRAGVRDGARGERGPRR